MKSDLKCPSTFLHIYRTGAVKLFLALGYTQRQNYSADYLALLLSFIYLFVELKLAGLSGMESFHWQVFIRKLHLLEHILELQRCI